MAYRTALIALLLTGQTFGGEPDPTEVIQRVTGRVAADVASIRNYTCVETVRRDFYKPQANTLPRACAASLLLRQHPTLDMVLRLTSMDRLRVEVTTTARGEIYSAVGSSRFDDGGINRIVRQGPIGTGMFNSFLGLVFGQDVLKFDFEGESTVESRRLYRYSYNVPRGDSHYRVRLVEATGWINSAYSGTVLVDPQTGDPVRLNVSTAELPPAAGSCQITGSVDYSRVPIGDHELLLAKQASQRFIAADGREVENTVTFADCREYSSESRMILEGEPASRSAGGSTTVSAVPERIPQGLPFTMELTAPIDSDKAASGDRFTATLTAPLRQGRKLLAPKGALVKGHLSMLEVIYRPEEAVIFGLTPETVEVRGTDVPLAAMRNVKVPTSPGARRAGLGLAFYLPPRGENAAVFHLRGAHAVLPRGFSSDWRTVDAGASRP